MWEIGKFILLDRASRRTVLVSKSAGKLPKVRQLVLKRVVITLLVLGLLLHLYTALMKSDQINAFSLGLMIWSWAPYLLIWVTTIRQSKYLRAFVPILFIFTADSLVHLAVFYSPQSSTASLGLLWMPLWNLILLVPLGMIFGIGVERYFRSDEH